MMVMATQSTCEHMLSNCNIIRSNVLRPIRESTEQTDTCPSAKRKAKALARRIKTKL